MISVGVLRDGRWSSVSALAVVAVLLIAPAIASAWPITLVGGDDILWARWSEQDAAAQASVVRLAYLPTEFPSNPFRLLPMAPAGGKISVAAASGRNIYVFFSDGTHCRFKAARGARRELVKTEFPELRLPGNELPLCLCSDHKDGSIVAVVNSGVAADIVALAAAEAQPEDSNTNGLSESEESSSGTEDAIGNAYTASRYALVKYAASSWNAICPIPDTFDDPMGIKMAALNGRVDLFFVATGEAAVRHISFEDEHWTEPEPIRTGDEAGELPYDRLLCVNANEDGVSVAVRDPLQVEDTYSIRSMMLRDGQWIVGNRFLAEEGDLVLSGEISVAGIGKQWAVLVPEAENEVKLGIWRVEGGAASMPLRVERALMPVPEQFVNTRTRMIIAVVMITIMMMMIFTRRRDSFLFDVPTPEGYVLASVGRRFVAGLIDLLIVVPLIYPIVNPWFVAHLDSSMGMLGDQWALAFEHYGDGLYWRWLVAFLVFATYGTVFELMTAATPGKLIMQLRVYTDRAQPCTAKAIILRNILRIVELYPMFDFAPTIILIALTRNRQRVGDLIARTVVVEKVRPEQQ